MPEGPEVRRSADYLSKLLVGKHIVNAFIGDGGRYTKLKPPTGFRDFVEDLSKGPCLIEAIDAKGKFMWWQLKRGDTTWFMWVTYGMSGQWRDEQNKYTTFGINYAERGIFDEEGRYVHPKALYFNDIRHFGTIHLVNDAQKHAKKLASLGPDMLRNPPTELEFQLRLSSRALKTVAEALMDQKVVSGIGNYVKAEALYLAEISPHRLVRSLTPAERRVLREQIINVMGASYATGGATISTYRNADGTKGGAQRRFAVYGNQTDPMGNPVVREETKDGRTTHWVPSVQH